MKFFFILCAIGTLFAIDNANGELIESRLTHFVRAEKDKLFEGDKEFRFISYNIPNLHYVEDDMRFEARIPFRFPNEFEIRDALLSIKQSGGQVVRIYTLSVRRPDDPPEMPRHVLGPGLFSEEAFVALDKCLQIANEYGIRLIVPFVDNWKWWGGRGDYAAFRGKEPDAFWHDPQIIDDFKKTIYYVLNRKNTFTGVSYKDDMAILAWETGNELTCPQSWTSSIAAYIKSIDHNHLVIDGRHTSTLVEESLNDPNVDIVTTHHYQKTAKEIVKLVLDNAKKARGKKPYFVGEFGFIDTKGIEQVCDAVINSRCVGALIWSLRPHNRDGGFYWHSEPYGGNLFKSYHWPGFPSGEAFDENGSVQLLREKAFEIQGENLPTITPPQKPELLPIGDVSAISWRGSAGAEHYRIERSENETGPWKIIAEHVTDAAVQYRPLYNDESAQIGKSYFYRVFAINEAGESPPSGVIQSAPVRNKTFIDECRDFARAAQAIGKPVIKNDEARKAREDCHRIRGSAGDALVYQLESAMSSFSIYAFYPDQRKDLIISGSPDGQHFVPLQFIRQDYDSGSGEYDYYKPVLFSAENIKQGLRYLKIEFPCTLELSRIEVKYGN